ncbi:MAG: TIR domain-containing protein [Pseudonocardia sp.]
MTTAARPVVFCSHASADKPRVKEFAERLRLDGIEAWVDGWEIDSGDDLVARINDGLDRCTAGLIFFSRNTPRSRWVSAEISALTERAVHGLRVIPVLLDHDADLPPLLEHYLRRAIDEYEAIRDTLLDRSSRPALGPLPEQLWSELLIRLTPADGDAVQVQVWQGGESVADQTLRRPALLAPSYRPGRAEQALTEVGRACGSLLFPGDALTRVNTFLAGRRQGDRLDVVIEAAPGLSRLPFEAARLPVPGVPLLVAQAGVTLLRRPLAPPTRLTPALPGPLKILIAVAAPDEGKTASSVLDGERELAKILGALPRHGAQARPLEVAGLSEISAALHQDAYHVLHLSGHGSADGIELEDEDGNPHLATPMVIAQAVDQGNRPLPLLFLSCCDAPTGADTAPGLAEALLAAGLSQVVALRGNVSDQYATSLAAAFYEALAASPNIEPAHALAKARRDLELARQRFELTRNRSPEHGAPAPPEFATATIFCWGTPQPVVGPGAQAPLKVRTAAVPSGPVPRLEVDDLVGRRAEVRAAMRVLLDDHRSVTTIGRRSGVTLCGVGGVGKSTVAGRIMARLVQRGWVTATVAGRLDVSTLCTAVAGALVEVDDDGARRLIGELLQPADDQIRLFRLGWALRDHRLLLVLDNFEDNVHPGGGKFREPATGTLVAGLLRAAVTGRILITSRYPVVPLATLLHDIRITPLSRSQTRKLLLRLPTLENLSYSDTLAVLRVTGGHPRLIELVDAAMRGNMVRLTSMTDRLDRHATELGVDFSTPREDLDASITDALDIQLRDIALTDLVADLAERERAMLIQAAVSTIPVKTQALAEILSHDDVSTIVSKLVRLSLLTPVDGNRVFVERWTAQGLKDVEPTDSWRQRCRRAAENHMVPGEGGIDIEDAMEAARNLVEATDFEPACTLAGSVAGLLQRQGQLITLAAFAGEILAQVPLDSLDARILAQYEADANHALGFTRAPETRWKQVIEALGQLVAAEPDRADYQRDLSVSYNKLGDLMVALGRGDDALRFFQQSLDIRTGLTQREPDRADYQRDLSVSYERLGDLKEAAGDLGDAIRLYELSLPLAAQLAENQPDRPSLQRDLQITYTRLAALLATAGRASEAAESQQLAAALDVRTTTPES